MASHNTCTICERRPQMETSVRCRPCQGIFNALRRATGHRTTFATEKRKAPTRLQVQIALEHGMEPITIEDLRNPNRKSGFEHVKISSAPGPRGGGGTTKYNAAVGAKKSPGDTWYGPRRATAEEAAQDYCDYINSNMVVVAAPKLKQANHPAPAKRKMDDEEREARAIIRAKQKARREGRVGNIYLVVETGDTSAVKVGHTYGDPPESRLNGGQTFNKRILVMVTYMEGSEAEERALHQKYVKDNILGEWFKATPEIVAEFGYSWGDFVAAVPDTQDERLLVA